MARYKPIDRNLQLLAVDLQAQVQPGSFENALRQLIDEELDLSAFDARYCNDATGASAYAPSVLLKVILFAYSRGIVSSRAIERACRENVLFMALSANATPHFTTLASFVSEAGEPIARLFSHVLYVCQREGLIGAQMFAIDGVKLPANASKERSGTRAQFAHQAGKLEQAVHRMLQQHRQEDMRAAADGSVAIESARGAQKIERLRTQAAQLRAWLHAHPADRAGHRGSVRKSNRTDNESAKMATAKGVIQGYTGVAAVDAKHQIILEAQAHGSGSEQALLMPVVNALAPLLTPETVITADAGYHSEANLKALAAQHIQALIADTGMRQRDERQLGRDVHRALPDPLWDKRPATPPAPHFGPDAFQFDPQANTCHCPAGKRLYRNGTNIIIRGLIGTKFGGSLRNCLPCALRAQCLKDPRKTRTRQVVFFRGPAPGRALTHSARMRLKIDSPEGRAGYGRRLAVVEPVFANLRHHKRLNRFTLRGRRKVDTQWKLYCLVHNIEKLANSRKEH